MVLQAGSTTHAKNKLAGQNLAFASLKRLYPGSGREIPAIWHGAGAYPSVVILSVDAAWVTAALLPRTALLADFGEAKQLKRTLTAAGRGAMFTREPCP